MCCVSCGLYDECGDRDVCCDRCEYMDEGACALKMEHIVLMENE